MAIAMPCILLFLTFWGETQSKRFRIAVWRPLMPVARGSALRATLLAVGVQMASGICYLVVGVLGVPASDAVSASWLAVAVVTLAGMLYAPVVCMAVPAECRSLDRRSRSAVRRHPTRLTLPAVIVLTR